jgi:hypothetical protein
LLPRKAVQSAWAEFRDKAAKADNRWAESAFIPH